MNGKALIMNPRQIGGHSDGVINVDEKGLRLSLHGATPFGGSLEGLQWVRDDGEVWELRATYDPKRWAGMRPRIEDWYAFQAAVDLLAYWEDQRMKNSYVEGLAIMVSLAAFYECPRCQNDPRVCHDCEFCQGDGFVWEGLAP